MKNLYLALCILGSALPLIAFGPWLLAHGLDVPLLLEQAVSSPVAAFAWADVLVSTLALLAFIAHQQRLRPLPRVWLPVLALFCVGVSLALPLYLYLRERQAAAA